MSIADAMALRGDGNGMGGFGGDFFLVILFLFLFGGNGFGQHGFGGAATAAAQNEILLGQNFDRVQTKLDGLANGMCDGFYALNSSVKDCCCNTQLGIAHLDAKIDQQTGVFTAMIKDAENQRLRDKVSDLQIGLSQCRQNEYLVSTLRPCPVPSYLTCSPYQAYSPCGCVGNYQPNI